MMAGTMTSGAGPATFPDFLLGFTGRHHYQQGQPVNQRHSGRLSKLLQHPLLNKPYK
jgi:hypothetical protein